mmetsp:Transcript_8230/g.11330  ORF Transcript_8230/g.11330 Transcript_8230/m.11330 type:complete len:262 (+) Transcript_8230:116-901(+)
MAWFCFELLQWKMSNCIGHITEDFSHVYVTNDAGLWKWNPRNEPSPVLLLNVKSNMAGLAWDRKSKLYICCPKTHQILQYDTSSEETVWFGIENIAGRSDGEITTATFDTPEEVTVDWDGNIYVTQRHGIRKIVKNEWVETIYPPVTLGVPSGICADENSTAISFSDYSQNRICVYDGVSSTGAVYHPAHAVWLPQGILVTSHAQKLMLFQHNLKVKNFEPIRLPTSKKPVLAVWRKVIEEFCLYVEPLCSDCSLCGVLRG